MFSLCRRQCAGIFSTWHHLLPNDIAVCGIQLPGRINLANLPLHTEISTLVAYLQQEMLPHLTDKPYSFFGYSLGALVAFELARNIHKHQQKMPNKLMVAACKSPKACRNKDKISHLCEQDLINKLIEYNGTPIEIIENKELMQLLLPIINADFSMNENYQYYPDIPLPCPIIAYGGTEDSSIAYEDLKSWESETREKFKLHMVPGDHFFINHRRKNFLAMLSKELTSFHDNFNPA